MSEWISVEGQLPWYGRRVLVALQGGVDIGRYYSDVDWNVGDLNFMPVTHWMPLPDPPEAHDE